MEDEKSTREEDLEADPATQNKNRSIHEFIVLSVVMFLIILVVGGMAFTFSMRQIIRANKGNELQRILEDERVKLETFINNEIVIVTKMAESPLITRYFADPENAELEAMALEEIDSYRSALSGTIFWVNDVDRMFHADGNAPYFVDPDAPKNDWYNKTLYKTKAYNFNINYNQDLNMTKLWVNAPVLNRQRQPVGMVGVGIDILELVGSLYDHSRGKAEFYFFNAGGEITGAKDAELVISKQHIEKQLGSAGVGVQTTAQKLKPGDTYVYDSPKGKIAIGTVPVLEWYSVAVMPDTFDDYITPMTALFIVMLVVIALIFIVFNIFIAGFLKSLRQTVQSLEATSSYKSEFLAMMSHEIRTPMSAVLGMAELALREKALDRAQEHVRTIKAAGTNLLSLINDILDFSKIESGKLEVVPANYQFSSLIRDVSNIIGIRAADARLEFRVNVDSGIPRALFGDEVRIRQIMLNILSNAVKYTSRGHVALAVKGEPADGETVNLTIEVSDTGRGIKKEDIGRLFKDFVQIDLVKNKGIEGTGLGLAITKKLVTTMGGSISVRSVYGKGSVFTVLLPQKVGSLDDAADEEAAPVFTTNGARALVVDDAATNLIVAQGLLATYNLQVDTCRSGAEAIEAVRREKYDLVFMDHMMPGMDGIEATMRIRNLGGRRYEKLPVIALTANAVSGMREMFMQNGFNDYLSKPIDMARLNAVLEKWVPKEKQVRLAGESAAAPAPAGDDEAAAVAGLAIEGLDVKKGMASVRGRAANYLRVLSVFCADGREKASDMRRALDTDNLQLYTTCVHALKSAAANIGAEALSEAAKNLETAGRDGNRAYINQYHPMLAAYLESLLTNIDYRLRALNSGPRAQGADTGALKAALAKLREAIATVNIGAIRASAKELQPFAGTAGAGPAVDGILKSTLRGDYDNAVGQIDGLLNQSL